MRDISLQNIVSKSLGGLYSSPCETSLKPHPEADVTSGCGKSISITPAAILTIVLLLISPQSGKAQSNPRPTSPDGLLRPEEVYRPPSIRERQARMHEMEREAAKPRTPEEQMLSLAEVAEDFKRIQLINNRMMAATMRAVAPDYGSIAGTTGEIRKRAIRIRKNLHLPNVEAEGAAKDSEHKQAQDAAQMKAALLSLDTCIMSFIQNPIFKNPDVIDVEQAARARRDLERIIGRSQVISKDAEKLRKSIENPR